MTPTFTHDFKFEVGEPQNHIRGDIEFNEDGKVSYKIEDSSIPLQNGTLKYFTELTELLKKIFYGSGRVKKVVFKEKTA